MRRAFLAVAVLLLVLVPTGCTRNTSYVGTQIQVGVMPVELVQTLAKDQTFRVNVELADASKQPVRGARVVAEILDADGVSLGKVTCSAVSKMPGRYQSDSFKAPQKAKAGAWKVIATVGQGENAVSRSVTVQVADPVSVVVQQGYGVSLNVPTTWWYYSYQESEKDARLLRFNPLPAGSAEEALLEIRFGPGKQEVSEEVTRKILTDYRPAGYEQGQSQVQSAVAVQIQGHNGWLVRGSFVTALGDDKTDRNFSLEVLRFYCDQTDRTFTIVKASTSDDVMAHMSAVLESFKCHE